MKQTATMASTLVYIQHHPIVIVSARHSGWSRALGAELARPELPWQDTSSDSSAPQSAPLPVVKRAEQYDRSVIYDTNQRNVTELDGPETQSSAIAARARTIALPTQSGPTNGNPTE